MSTDYRVVVEGGGSDLYKIGEVSDKYYVSQVSVGLFSNSNKSIGKANSLDTALALIKAHSGEDIKEITEI